MMCREIKIIVKRKQSIFATVQFSTTLERHCRMKN